MVPQVFLPVPYAFSPKLFFFLALFENYCQKYWLDFHHQGGESWPTWPRVEYSFGFNCIKLLYFLIWTKNLLICLKNTHVSLTIHNIDSKITLTITVLRTSLQSNLNIAWTQKETNDYLFNSLGYLGLSPEA